MDKRPGCQECDSREAAEQIAKTLDSVLSICCCAKPVHQLIRKEMELERARVAEEEAKLWSRAFGAAAPAERKTQTRQHEQINAALAFRAQVDAPP
jgi:hypothetical protein